MLLGSSQLCSRAASRASTYAPKRALTPIAALLLASLLGCEDDEPKPVTADASMVSTSDAGSDSNGDRGSASTPGTDNLPPIALDKAVPIIFVHGFAGSAQQLISQAMRYESNGYPAGRIRAFEHNGGQSTEDFPGMLDKFIDQALADYKVEKIFLIGHSRGTQVSSTYMGMPERAKKVAKYISLDGFGCGAAQTANIPCIDPSQRSLPGQSHVEVATSKESFIEQWKFLVGGDPQVTDIVKQKAPVEISGRAVNFPENTGRAGTTLDMYAIDANTGMRVGDKVKSWTLGDDGSWGPITVDPTKHYEFVLYASESSYHHHYMQPFLRSTPFVRFLSGPPDTESRKNTNSGPNHVAAIVSRMREWQTSDKLEIGTKTPSDSQPAMNVITGDVGVDPTGGTDIASLVRGRIAINVHDDAATPKMTTLAPLPWFSTQPFQTGVDVYMPASDPPNGTVTFKSIPRGDASRPQILNTPNWASSTHLISLMFADYAQD